MKKTKRIHLVTERRLAGDAAVSVNVSAFITNDRVESFKITLWSTTPQYVLIILRNIFI